MRTVIIAAVVGLGLVGCQSQREEAQSQREELNEERAQFGQEASETRAQAQQDIAQTREQAQQDIAETKQETEQQIAEGRQDVEQKEQELAQSNQEAMNEGTGGSGMDTNLAIGTLKSSMGSNLVLDDPQGAELKLKTDDNTIVKYEGKRVKLDDFEEGTRVRASYSVKGDEKVVREITILQPAPKSK